MPAFTEVVQYAYRCHNGRHEVVVVVRSLQGYLPPSFPLSPPKAGPPMFSPELWYTLKDSCSAVSVPVYPFKMHGKHRSAGSTNSIIVWAGLLDVLSPHCKTSSLLRYRENTLRTDESCANPGTLHVMQRNLEKCK